ncbi:MAG: AAA family ATPase [Ferruginibacter sp.]
MAHTITAIVVIGIVVAMVPGAMAAIKKAFLKLAQKLIGAHKGDIFDNSYIDVKTFYLHEFGKLPCITHVDSLDVTKVFDFVNAGNAGTVLAVYQRNYYSWHYKRQQFNKTLFKLGNKVMIELGHDYAQVLFDSSNYDYANTLMERFIEYKSPEKEEAFEINIITINNNCLDLKQLEIKPTQLDISLYYNDDFAAVDEVIRERLEKDNDKGIILLHGLPGTGKTTYLRHLIGGMKKKVLFVSPGVAENLMNPEFIDLLIDNPNAVLVIEDAENIIMDRKFNKNSSVSNLLNISDGLLSDCLNVQIICTFNNALSTVDSALMRKGRLIAKYEFNKLDAVKAQKLSDHLGFSNKIDKPMTLAEITNPGDMEVAATQVQVMGFRREALMN